MVPNVAIALVVIAAWLAWPRVVRYAWRRAAISPTAATALIVARAPVVLGVAAWAAGTSALVLLIVIAASTVPSLLLLRYFRDSLEAAKRA